MVQLLLHSSVVISQKIRHLFKQVRAITQNLTVKNAILILRGDWYKDFLDK